MCPSSTSPLSLRASSAYPTTNTHSMIRPLKTITALRVRARVTCQQIDRYNYIDVKKGVVQYLVRWTVQSTVYPWEDMFIPAPTRLLWEARQQLCAKTIHSYFHHCLQPGTHLYRYLTGLGGGQGMKKNAHALKRQQTGFEPGLPELRVRLSHRAPQTEVQTVTDSVQYYILEVAHFVSSQCTIFTLSWRECQDSAFGSVCLFVCVTQKQLLRIYLSSTEDMICARG